MEELVWVGALLFVIAVWLFMASEWGTVVEVSDEGFVFRDRLRRLRLIRWSKIAGRSQLFESPLKRVIVPLRKQTVLQVHASIAVLLHGTTVDDLLLERLKGITEFVRVDSFSDLIRGGSSRTPK